ncbi:MAG: vgb 1, partial [Solirubrobacterales bacterium]|nr:vgb 1 [Solirubrobacterales bacterium]
DCMTPLPPPKVVLGGQGSLESVIVDGRGRLFYTDSTAKALMRLDRPGARPAVVLGGIDAPGGLAFDADGRHLFVGQGDSVAGGLQGNLVPAASLLRVDVDTGAATVFAKGLRMANGLVRATDGTLFASSDVGTSIDRISGDGVVRSGWAAVFSGNGMAIDAAQTSLFVNQTFRPAAISRISLQDPTSVSTFFAASGADITAGLDGMTIDPSDRLVSAANLAGEVWRIGTDGQACALGRGLKTTSAVAYGHGPDGFSEGRLFAVGFDGVLAEIPGGQVMLTAPPELVDGPAPTTEAVAVTVLPVTARVRGDRVRVVLHVRRGARFVASRVLVGRRVLRTGRRVSVPVSPRATRLVVRFRLAGRGYVRSVRLVR